MIWMENELFAQFVLLSGLKIYFFWQKYTSQTKYFFGPLSNRSPCKYKPSLICISTRHMRLPFQDSRQDTNTRVNTQVHNTIQHNITDPGIDLVSTMAQIASKVNSTDLSDASGHISWIWICRISTVFCDHYKFVSVTGDEQWRCDNVVRKGSCMC